jgi:hypothetical protein
MGLPTKFMTALVREARDLSECRLRLSVVGSMPKRVSGFPSQHPRSVTYH